MHITLSPKNWVLQYAAEFAKSANNFFLRDGLAWLIDSNAINARTKSLINFVDSNCMIKWTGKIGSPRFALLDTLRYIVMSSHSCTVRYELEQYEKFTSYG